MVTFRKTLLAAGLLALIGQDAAAQPVSGLYLGAGAGANFWHDQSSGGIRVHDTNTGIVALGAIGWGFGNGFRAEVEGNYRGSSMDLLTTTAGGIGNTGNVRNYGVMVNLLFDFDLSSFGLPPTAVMPYIGGGIGYGWMQIGDARFAAAGSSVYQINDTDGQFAYQGIAGASWGLGGMVPGLSLTTEYRFYGTSDQTLSVTRISGPTVAGVPGSVKLANANHAAIIGLRYAFNPPRPASPPPATPVEAPAPARTYLVFFDWDRADLTDRARQIIAEAAQNARRVQSTRIEVAGHADRSGTPQYNMGLSRRRADNVAAELVRQGISRNEIAVTAFGETRPLVPTADGVREPQNRRVEIVLR